MISAVVFDLDYTLAVPSRERQAVLDEATEAVGAPSMTREEYLEAHGRNLASESRDPIFEELLAKHDSDVPPEALSEAYREALAAALAPIEDGEKLVADLRETYKVGLLTNGPLTAQRSKVESLDWTDLFDAIVITGELEAGKPDERAFRAVLDALNVSADEAVYIGDDVDADIHGAKDVGMFAVQVCFEGGPDPDPRADVHVDRDALSRELPDVLAELD